jgi:hypothetical protein
MINDAEHKLILLMLAHQMQTTIILLEMLRAKEVIAEDDFAAFQSFSLSSEELQACVKQLGKLYREAAAQVGIELPPEFPRTDAGFFSERKKDSEST